MTNITKQNNVITSFKEFQAILQFTQVASVGVEGTVLELLDYEIYFRTHYFVRFNTISTKYERASKIIKEGDVEESLEWVNLSIEELTNDMIRAGAKGRGKLTEQEVARMLADRRLVPEFNPLIGYFRSVYSKLEGTDNFDYIDQFASFLTVEGGDKEQARWKSNLKKALVRTVKCAVDQKYFNKHALVLYSENQSVGKTSYLRTLCPPSLQKYYFEGAVGVDKDSETVLVKNFMIMVDELANLSRVDINTLKATLSKLHVNIRLPYAKNFEEFPRTASFFATTNRTDFLTDSQNVRWIVINVDNIDRAYGNIFTGKFNIDVDLIWGQAYKLYLEGYNCELSKEDLEANEDNNVLYSATSLEKEVISSYFTPAKSTDNNKKGFRRAQPSEIFELACKYLESDGKLYTLKSIRQNIFFSELTRMTGWKKVSMRINGRSVAGYYFLDNKEVSEGELPF
jgi:predicted P-loop ATPase